MVKFIQFYRGACFIKTDRKWPPYLPEYKTPLSSQGNIQDKKLLVELIKKLCVLTVSFCVLWLCMHICSNNLPDHEYATSTLWEIQNLSHYLQNQIVPPAQLLEKRPLMIGSITHVAVFLPRICPFCRGAMRSSLRCALTMKGPDCHIPFIINSLKLLLSLILYLPKETKTEPW